MEHKKRGAQKSKQADRTDSCAAFDRFNVI